MEKPLLAGGSAGESSSSSSRSRISNNNIYGPPQQEDLEYSPTPLPFQQRSSAIAYGDPYQKAAALVDLAEDGMGLPEQVLEDSRFGSKSEIYFIFIRFNILWSLNLFALIALNFLEKPLWCVKYSSRYYSACDDDREYFFLGQLPYLSTSNSLLYEGVTLFILNLHTFFPIAFEGYHIYWNNPLNKMKVIAIVILFLDLMVYGLYLSPSMPINSLPLRIAPYIRVILFIMNFRELRACIVTLAGMLSTYFNVMGLLFMFLLFSSWLAYVMFEDTQQGKTTFYSYEVTLYQMFLLFTTFNNPAVWVPAYKESRWYAIFFAFYVLLGFYFVRNLILAVVYEGFKAQLAKEVSETDAMRKRVLGKAFSLLDVYKKGSLEKNQCIRLFEELNKYRSLPKISREEFEFIFHELDDSGDFKIDLDEFNDLCYAIALRFQKEAPPSWFDNYPAFYRSDPCEKLKAFVRSSTFGNIITVMLILNLVAVAIETRLDIENNSAHKIWQEVEFVFGWIYALEMVLKVFSYGFEGYWMKGQNRFDFVITWIIVIGETATVALPGVHFLSNGEWMRYLLIARMLRLIRLLTNVRHCRVFVATFLTLIPTLMPYLGTIFCVLCIYCSLGLQIFGGVVNSGNPKLKETALYDNDFLLFNFNDYPNGMVALYNMLVGPWAIWMKSYQKLVGNSWSLPYFISFFLTSALLLFNLVVAFVLEAFNTEMDLNAAKKSEEEDKEGEGRKACRSIGSKTRSHRVDKLLRHILSAKLNESQV